MKWFNNCKNVDEVKALYRKLAKENHPDKGGDTATMQAINNEYAYAIRYVVREGQNAGRYTQQQAEDEINASEAYKEAIEKIIDIEGLILELVGKWIWVTGETKANRGRLKEAGYFYASKKEAWYFRTEEWKCRNRRKMTLDEIKRRYGSQRITKTRNNEEKERSFVQ